MHVAKTYDELIKEAREAETTDVDAAIKLYERAVKQEPHAETAYNRLMIVYRKEKMYEEELALIEKGIKAYREFFDKRSAPVRKNAKAVQISNALAKSLGLKDKKGNDQVEKEPIASWLKRKEMVEKKVKGQRAKVKKSQGRSVIASEAKQVKGQRAKVKSENAKVKSQKSKKN